MVASGDREAKIRCARPTPSFETNDCQRDLAMRRRDNTDDSSQRTVSAASFGRRVRMPGQPCFSDKAITTLGQRSSGHQRAGGRTRLGDSLVTASRRPRLANQSCIMVYMY